MRPLSEILKNLVEDYGIRGTPEEEAGWESREDSRGIYEFIGKRLLAPGDSVLDIGAGTGLLYEHLVRTGLQVSYEAAEVSEYFRKRLREAYPGMTVHEYDVIKSVPPRDYDWMVMVGVTTDFPRGVSDVGRVLRNLEGYYRKGLYIDFLHEDLFIPPKEEYPRGEPPKLYKPDAIVRAVGDRPFVLLSPVWREFFAVVVFPDTQAIMRWLGQTAKP